MKYIDEDEARLWDGWYWPWFPRYETGTHQDHRGRSYAKSWVALDRDGAVLAVLVGPDWSAESATQELERRHAECTVRECKNVCVHHRWNLHDWDESAMFAAEGG